MALWPWTMIILTWSYSGRVRIELVEPSHIYCILPSILDYCTSPQIFIRLKFKRISCILYSSNLLIVIGTSPKSAMSLILLNNAACQSNLLKIWLCYKCCSQGKKWQVKLWNIKMLIRLIETVIMTLFSQILRSEFAVFLSQLCKTKGFFCCQKGLAGTSIYINQYSHMAFNVLFSIHEPIHLGTIFIDRQKMWNLYCSTTVSYIPWHRISSMKKIV